ncbi:MAG: hypothetical protein A4E36_00097 [Methanoregulaceae archaeon PtaB.Bin009]|jgi:hypothetical protein|nr:MAG: hypothetical protein A4E36_00097 [Methanoregulaceae archaeon PtaB.Bin009]OPY42367.1 MAG: hypothetical protein A4E41_00359 [Methanoregulaceae archaeon PtaU1.Bin066]
MVTTMTEVTPKEVAGLSSASTPGQESADHVSQPKTISTWTRAGSISLEKAALRIDYESFGKSHVAYVSLRGIRSLIGPTQMPADVEEVRTGIDGTEVISQVGKAWRSRSGKALVINTSQSQGELMVPWTGFKKVIEKKVEKARLSRFTPPDKPRPRPSTETGNPMNAGLARGF